jgi:hypothetical protein
MEFNFSIQTRNVDSSGGLITSLAEKLGENPAQLATELLNTLEMTELHLLLLCELDRRLDDDNLVSVAQIVLLMKVTDVDLIRHVAARRRKTFVLHTTIDGMEQQTETFAFANDSEAPSLLHVYKEQYEPEFKGFDGSVQYKSYGRGD